MAPCLNLKRVIFWFHFYLFVSIRLVSPYFPGLLFVVGLGARKDEEFWLWVMSDKEFNQTVLLQDEEFEKTFNQVLDNREFAQAVALAEKASLKQSCTLCFV